MSFQMMSVVCFVVFTLSLESKGSWHLLKCGPIQHHYFQHGAVSVEGKRAVSKMSQIVCSSRLASPSVHFAQNSLSFCFSCSMR